MTGRPVFGWLGLACLIAWGLLDCGCSAPEFDFDAPPPDRVASCSDAGTYSSDRCVEVCASEGFAFGKCDDYTPCVVLRSAGDVAPVVRLTGEGKPDFEAAECELGQ
jgi:hypothetical protein